MSGIVTEFETRTAPPLIPKLSVVVPVYNEHATIEEILCRIQAVDVHKEIIVVDDGSTDGTLTFLLELAACINAGISCMQVGDGGRVLRIDNIRVIFQAKNGGKGAAVRRGFQAARGDLVVVQDGDLELDPEDYVKLMEPIHKGIADVVNGSRFLSGSDCKSPYWHYLGNQALTAASNATTNLLLSDVLCCYKMLRRDVLKRIDLREDGFGHETEIIAKLAKAKCRICEVPISYRRRSHAQGKKISWKDSFRTLWCILRYGLLR